VVTQVRIKVTPVYDRLYRTVKSLTGLTTIVEVGGAGSSKSHSIAQLLIQLLTEHTGLRIGVGRKTFPAHRTSGMALVIELLKSYGIYHASNHNRGEFTYQHNGNTILFFSLGEGESGREKMKSANFNIIWLEEATEFDLADYRQLMLRLRHPAPAGLHNFMLLSHNPIDENHWIKKELIDKDPSVIVHHSTYHDNTFIAEDYRKLLEDLKNQDQNYYRIYVLGEWGRLENIIYSNWRTALTPPPDYEAWAYGLDFGFNVATALIKVGMVKNQVYLEEKIYRANLTNSDLIELLTHQARADIYADSAEPQRIEEIRRAGWNIYSAEKDVKLGIDLCKRQTLNISAESVNLLKEIKGYQWKTDKNGNRLDEPVKFNDHACDAFRYCLYGLTKRFGFATARPTGQRVRATHHF
jgi:phage terminase large subunit